MATIEVDGKKYRVVERLPYHNAGCTAVVVVYPDYPMNERVAVKLGVWRWWDAKDRVSSGGMPRIG
jgi:hypothetical protein